MLTLESQFVSHKPGVPQGQRVVPPESKQAGSVKSFENQNIMAELIELRRVELPTYWAAFFNPPCQAAAKVSFETNERFHVDLKYEPTHWYDSNAIVQAN